MKNFPESPSGDLLKAFENTGRDLGISFAVYEVRFKSLIRGNNIIKPGYLRIS